MLGARTREAARAADDRLLARQRGEGLAQAARRRARDRRAARRRRAPHRRRDGRKPPRRRPAGSRAGQAAHVRAKHHVRLHRLADLGKDIQALSHRLHSSKLEYLGFVSTAKSFCRELSEQRNVQIEFRHSDMPAVIPKEISLCLFRVLQEALQNAVKHSAVQNFTVELLGTKEGISLRVTDSGVGFDWHDAIDRKGLGLISMRERLRLVNGELSIQSEPGRGTTVLARVPHQEEPRSMGIAG